MANSVKDSDFIVSDHFTIFLLTPLTESATDWVSEHLPPDALRFGDSIAVEHRFIGDIIDGVQQDGLTISVQ